MQNKRDNKFIEIRIFNQCNNVIFFSFFCNSLIKLIAWDIFLSQRTDFEKSRTRLKNFQNYNRSYKLENVQLSLHFIFFWIEILWTIAKTAVFALQLMSFKIFSISINRLKRRALALIIVLFSRIFEFIKSLFVIIFWKIRSFAFKFLTTF